MNFDYPPSKGSLTITLHSALQQGAVAEIFTSEGKFVTSKVFAEPSEMTFDLHGYPAGLYLIKLSAGGEMMSSKFCLE
jgi:hypothetical protein